MHMNTRMSTRSTRDTNPKKLVLEAQAITHWQARNTLNKRQPCATVATHAQAHTGVQACKGSYRCAGMQGPIQACARHWLQHVWAGAQLRNSTRVHLTPSRISFHTFHIFEKFDIFDMFDIFDTFGKGTCWKPQLVQVALLFVCVSVFDWGTGAEGPKVEGVACVACLIHNPQFRGIFAT